MILANTNIDPLSPSHDLATIIKQITAHTNGSFDPTRYLHSYKLLYQVMVPCLKLDEEAIIDIVLDIHIGRESI